MKPGVYVHIPFCEQRCYYCAFTVAVSPQLAHEPYVRRLIREIQLSQFSEEPETIFFGAEHPQSLTVCGFKKFSRLFRKAPKKSASKRIPARSTRLSSNAGPAPAS